MKVGLSLLICMSLSAAVNGQTVDASIVGERSPVDVAVASRAGLLLSANETAGSVSLIDWEKKKVIDELVVGSHPATIVVARDESFALVSCTYSGEVVKLAFLDGTLREIGRLRVGFEPVGLALNRSGETAYVGRTSNATVVEISAETMESKRIFEVGHWPRYLAISHDETRLAVGLSGESRIAVVDLESGERLFTQYMTGAINIGHLQASKDGTYVYFPWMVYRDNPITPMFIRLGWVLASRIGRTRLDGPAYREAISLDVPGKAVADPHGITMSSDERRMVISASGTHELLVYRKPDLPFSGAGGPGDLIDRRLLADNDLFYRIPLGGRPMGIDMASDDRTVVVANYLNDSIQTVDIESREITSEIRLSQNLKDTSARRGAAIFYDGTKSLDQWYSCHSCHYNGGVNARSMDTWNDGSRLTNKTVLPLYDVNQTGPWTWHGWQGDLKDAMRKSFTVTMQGEGVSQVEANDVITYLSSIKRPQNPFRQSDGTLTESASRGKAIFESDFAGCNQCHSGKFYTDGQIHDVGTGEDEDAYPGFNTPSLVGVYRKVRFLHDGRMKSLEATLTEEHAPDKVAGTRPLKESELADLVEYLKSL